MKRYLFIGIASLFAGMQITAQQIMSAADKASTYNYAQEMFSDARYDLAIEFCSKIIASDRDLDVFNLRAKSYRAIGDYYNAANDYTETIQMQSRMGKRNANLFFDRARVYICLKKFKEAFSDLNEARRIFRDSGKENFIYQEEMGRVSHYLGDNKSAIMTMRDAIRNGSNAARIDLLGAFLQSEFLPELKTYSDSLLATELSDSMTYYYVNALNDIARGSVDSATLEKINFSIANYRTSNTQCFQGFYYDILYGKALISSMLGNDSLAYAKYREVYLSNNNTAGVKNKLDILKVKLGLDAIGPAVGLRTPQVGMDNVANINASTGKYTIYGEVMDSSGLAAVKVYCNGRELPISLSNIENDGLFEAKLELKPNMNTLVITAIDKFDNITEKTFHINYNEVAFSQRPVLDSLGEDDLPVISPDINYYALLIAEKDYSDEGFNDLESPVNDASALRDVLTRQYGFVEKNVMLLANAARTDIIDSLYKMCRMMTDADNLLVFYAGHGDVKKVNGKVDGGFIIPSDAKKGSRGSYLSSEDLLEPVETCAARHILFVVDACFGGALLNRSSLEEAPQSIKNLYNNKSRRVMTSGNLEEVPDKGNFISNFLKYMYNPGSKYFSDQDLFTYIQNNNNSTAVTPMFERIRNSGDAGGGQFIFVNKNFVR